MSEEGLSETAAKLEEAVTQLTKCHLKLAGAMKFRAAAEAECKKVKAELRKARNELGHYRAKANERETELRSVYAFLNRNIWVPHRGMAEICFSCWGLKSRGHRKECKLVALVKASTFSPKMKSLDVSPSERGVVRTMKGKRQSPSSLKETTAASSESTSVSRSAEKIDTQTLALVRMSDTTSPPS